MTNDELDRLAAEKIMGWKIMESGCFQRPGPTYDYCFITPSEYQPSRHIAQAWEVLEKLSDEFFCYIKQLKDDNWYCYFTLKNDPLEPRGGHNGETAQLAIVKACLKAKGVEIE